MESQASGNGFEVVGDECLQVGDIEELLDRLALGRQTLDVLADERFQVHFTLDVEVSSYAGELVCPAFGSIEGELFHLPFVQQAAHCSSSALNLSWSMVHSIWVTSLRGPRYTG